MSKELIEWGLHYLKYKDTVLRRYKSIEKGNDCIIATKKTGGADKYLCVNSLKDLDLSSIKEHRIICLNSKENIFFTKENWNDLTKENYFMIYANPKSKQSWAIHTQNHHAVTEKESLELGLKSLFESIEQV